MTLPINDCPHCGCSTFYRNQGGFLWDLIYLYIVETKKSGVKNHSTASLNFTLITGVKKRHSTFPFKNYFRINC